MGELQRLFEKSGGAPKPKPAGDKKQAGELAAAGTEIQSLKKSLINNRGRIEEAGILVISLAETTGTNLLASAAEGYWGEDKLKVGPVDLRLASGTALGAYGLYRVMHGKGGTHEISLASGLLQSFMASAGRGAGKALADKGAQAANGQAAPAAASNEPIYELNGKKYRLDAKSNLLVEISGGGADPGQMVRDIGARLQVGPSAEGDDASGRRRHRDDDRRDRRAPREFIPARRR